MRRQVAFVAPLPPPVHGFSNICASMLELLGERVSVCVFDRAPRDQGGWGARINQLIKPLSYLRWCMKNPGAELYLALSGGLGQLLDWPYVIFSRLFGYRVFVHHHSFAYINGPSLLNRLFFRTLRESTHIVLSEKMGSELSRVFRVAASKIQVISNAAFYAPVPDSVRRQEGVDDPIRVGYLSAVSFEKGIVEFFSVLAELRGAGIAYRAHIAGPIAPAASTAFADLLAASTDVLYYGPIYDEQKDKFYANLDVFLFPTGYVNEAEPLVIHEALRCGVHVVACDRGAIAEILVNGAGVVCPRGLFVATATSRIRDFSVNRDELKHAQLMSLEQARRLRSDARIEVAAFLGEISGTPNKAMVGAAISLSICWSVFGMHCLHHI